ncbi:HlyD family type I secretion periplasmic adaptor subunit [Thalassobaculum sp. OXR-137]|uniref:HlyD family type I secretion periplasmic adaptor subunit n=1 Tax=Thalassobaculum sp. OXR-137 TaxID=3100173 RepID=UPI002AC9E267|nr:HlyD family type I secretion periplasmic adaptor subunit [Thalassobaculum sp. OXR-137]WPZ36936.1 HlyD family type I secretion periplasmic adaptor subunit [Thalassobaculum sp. OXR-137]
MAMVRSEESRDLTRWQDPLAHEPDRNPMAWRKVLWIGYAILFLFFGVFGVWAGFAPLGSGAIAMGQVQVAGSQKVVQHLEGGIIKEIRVQEGDTVKEGDVLMVLEGTRASVDQGRLFQRVLALKGQEARLIAERDETAVVSYPDDLKRLADDPYVQSIMDGESRLFDGRRAAYQGQQGLLDKRVAKSREEIVALRAQQRSDARQLQIIEEEIKGVRELFNKGLERKPRLLALEREQAALQGSIDNREALMARAEQTIAETEYQRLTVQEQNRAEIETDLRETQTQLRDLREQLVSADDSIARNTVRAPIGGKVYGLRFHTVGGVIGPAEPLLNIAPDDDELIVRAQLQPTDIDVVQIGAPATVRLTSYSQRTAKPIDGRVIDISPDVMQSAEGTQPYYEARVRLSEEMMRQNDVELVPGMPAMVIISTGDQTLLDYLISPLTRSLETALREQ